MLRCAEVVTIATLRQSTALCHDFNVIRITLWLYKLFNHIQFCNQLIEMLEVCAQVQFWSWREWCWTMCRCLHSTAVCWQPIVDYYSRPTEGTESECPWGENTSSSWTWWRTDTAHDSFTASGTFLCVLRSRRLWRYSHKTMFGYENVHVQMRGHYI